MHFMIVRYTSESHIRIANEVYSHKVIHILYSVRRKGADGTSDGCLRIYFRYFMIFCSGIFTIFCTTACESGH